LGTEGGVEREGRERRGVREKRENEVGQRAEKRAHWDVMNEVVFMSK